MSKIKVLEQEVTITSVKDEDYICLTDIAKHRNMDDPRFVIQNWMRTRATVEFLGIWEHLNNPNFNRVDFEAVKNEACSNALAQDLAKHKQQYPPIEAREFADSHDRFLILDGETVYHLGASLKDLGKKWFAFSRMEKSGLKVMEKLGGAWV